MKRQLSVFLSFFNPSGSGFSPALFLLVAVNGTSWAEAFNLAGVWQLNLTESDKIAVKYKEGSGTGRRNLMQGATVSIGGLPLPSTSSRIPSQSTLAPKNPEVLLSNRMEINAEGDRLVLTYDDTEKEIMRRGDYRGRTSTWGSKGIKQTYKTPDRKVTKNWSIRKDGRLLVEVKLNPPRDKARTYKRVFDRVTATTGPAESSD